MEHLRLEREATGRYLACAVVPIGETLNHAATIIVLLGLLVLAEPLGHTRDWRDAWIVVGPAAFLALGWRDEIVYHRRRAAHREDIMHTVSHLAAGVMLTTLVLTRVVSW